MKKRNWNQGVRHPAYTLSAEITLRLFPSTPCLEALSGRLLTCRCLPFGLSDPARPRRRNDMTKPKTPKTPQTAQSPQSFDDLKPAPYNPRLISDAARAGLSVSITEFGDIGGITWNSRTGHLVTGHQRVKALREQGATFDPDGPAIRLNGAAFPVRVVDRDEEIEKAANISANNPHISGEYSEALPDLLDDLKGLEHFKELRLPELRPAPMPTWSRDCRRQISGTIVNS